MLSSVLPSDWRTDNFSRVKIHLVVLEDYEENNTHFTIVAKFAFGHGNLLKRM